MDLFILGPHTFLLVLRESRTSLENLADGKGGGGGGSGTFFRPRYRKGCSSILILGRHMSTQPTYLQAKQIENKKK